MSTGSVRKGITQANFNEQQFGILATEIFFIAAAAGLWKQSWYFFGGVLIGLLIVLFIPFVNKLLMLALSLVWGAAGYLIGRTLFSESAGYVIGGLALLAALGLHLSALEYARDLGDTEDRNM